MAWGAVMHPVPFYLIKRGEQETSGGMASDIKSKEYEE